MTTVWYQIECVRCDNRRDLWIDTDLRHLRTPDEQALIIVEDEGWKRTLAGLDTAFCPDCALANRQYHLTRGCGPESLHRRMEYRKTSQ